MFSVKEAREEMAKLHAEALAHNEKYSAADAVESEEDATAQADRIKRLEKLDKAIKENEKLASYTFSKVEPEAGFAKNAPKATAVELKATPEIAPVQTTYSRDDLAGGLSSWVQSDLPDTYATITVTGNAAIIPSVVVDPITPVKYNCYRAAAMKLGVPPVTYGNTAPATVPVVSSSTGGLIPEGIQNSQNDANPSIGTMVLTAHGYQSKTYWWSNEAINAEQFDVTASMLPALQGAREYGFSAALSAALIADSSITQSVTTASPTTITIGNMDSLIHAFSLAYDFNKAIFVGMDTYNALESLTDSNGRPIFEMFTIQDQNFYAYKGVPVFKHDTFQTLSAAGNVVGVCVSFVGFRLRDEQEKLIKYVDSPANVDMTGLNNVRYQGWGYVPAAVVKLVAG